MNIYLPIAEMSVNIFLLLGTLKFNVPNSGPIPNKDLAELVGNNQDWLETIPFLEELEKKLNSVMNN